MADKTIKTSNLFLCEISIFHLKINIIELAWPHIAKEGLIGDSRCPVPPVAREQAASSHS